MNMPRALCTLSVAFCVASTPSWAVKQKVPPELEAKRSGKVSQATPAPLNLVYTPITPCRAFANQALGAGQTKNLQVTGGDLSGQGGSAAGCGVPASAKAVTITLTASVSAVNTFVTAYATGAPRPPYTNLVAPTSGAYNIGESTVQLGSAGRLSAYATKATKIWGDVTGYYEPQIWVYLASGGGVIDSSGRVTSTAKTGTGEYAVTFDRDVSACSGVASSDITGHIMSVYTSGNSAYVYIDDNAGNAADYWVNLQIKC